MISAHQALIHSRPQLDSLLKIFSTFSDESDDIDPAKFWRSTYPRGVYLLAATIPPLANHHVKIKLANASHLRTNEPSSGTTLMAPTDSVGKDITDARSSYQYRLMDRTITGFIKPNPYRSQTVHPGGHPDLFLRTCLNYADKDSFRELFLGGDPHNNSAMWRLLDSPDISLVLHRPNPRIITSDAQIQITNGGDIDAPAGALLTVTAYLLPYSGSEVQQAPFHILPTLVTRGSVQLPSISFATNSMPTVTAVVKMDDFEIFYPKPFPPHLPPTVTVPAFVKAIAITVAEISQVKGESLLSNNKAIEITQVEV
jgi:hypothetical protein